MNIDLDRSIVECLEDYLASKQCVMWGRTFDVTQPDTRRQAAEWLYSQIVGVIEMADA